MYVSATIAHFTKSTPIATTVLLLGLIGILVGTIIIVKMFKKGKFDVPIENNP